jgi:hypothetical protein
MTLLAIMGGMLCGMTPALADVNSYCEAYARDQADAHLTGGAILGTAMVLSPEERDASGKQILAECLALYEPEQQPRPRPIARKSVTTVASSTGLVRGSEAWKNYCDKKYTSFDRKTGMYKSLTGKVRPCLVTRN